MCHINHSIKMTTSETEDKKLAECITLKLSEGAKVNEKKGVQTEPSEISGEEKERSFKGGSL